MFKQRAKPARLTWGLCCTALPLLLAHCGAGSDQLAGAGGAGGNAGASTAPGGAAGALGGAMSVSGAPAGGTGNAGASPNGGLGGDSAAGGSAIAAGAGAGGQAEGAAGSGECGIELTSYTSPSAAHVAVCSSISYPMNPPVYGDHYPVWAAYKSYAFPVPLGFLVHNLEHGAIVLLYNCPEGCAEEVATAIAFVDSLPADPRCADEIKHQVVLSPDPSLPTRWGAVAWGHSLASDCFAPAAYRAFYEANLAHGGEDLCSDGADLSADTCQ
ncbi:MAG TPA: DUF3105 domain-containing protein [Polyangiaceae bacterium]